MNIKIEKSVLAKVVRSKANLVMSVTGLGMLFGLLMDVAIVVNLGLSGMADALVLALTVPVLVDVLFREGTKLSLVPLLVRQRTDLTDVLYERFVSAVLNITMLVGVLAAILVWALSEWVIAVIGLGLTPNMAGEASMMLGALAPMIVFSAGTSVLSAYHNSARNFVYVALRNGAVPIIVLVCLVTLKEFPVEWRVVHGFNLGVLLYFILLLIVATKIGFRYSPFSFPSRSDFRRLGSAIGYPVVGFTVRQFLRLFERSIASSLFPGAVTSYYLATRIQTAVQNVIGFSSAVVNSPSLSKAAIIDSDRTFRRKLKTHIVGPAVLGTMASTIVYLLGYDVVSSLFGNGKDYATQVKVTSDVLLILSLGFPFACVLPLLQTAGYAREKNQLMLVEVVGIALLNVGLILVLIERFALAGVAAAATLATIADAGIMAVIAASVTRIKQQR